MGVKNIFLCLSQCPLLAEQRGFYRSFTQPLGFSTRSNFHRPRCRPPIAIVIERISVYTGSICARTTAQRGGTKSAAVRKPRQRRVARRHGESRGQGGRTSADGVLRKNPVMHPLRPPRRRPESALSSRAAEQRTRTEAAASVVAARRLSGRTTATVAHLHRACLPPLFVIFCRYRGALSPATVTSDMTPATIARNTITFIISTASPALMPAMAGRWCGGAAAVGCRGAAYGSVRPRRTEAPDAESGGARAPRGGEFSCSPTC